MGTNTNKANTPQENKNYKRIAIILNSATL